VPLREADVEIDLHRPFVDNIIFEKNGRTYRRIKEVVDVWFDSGSMPFAQLHYPFEKQELFEKIFPGDFIAEGIDQTRGWFYTLHNIAVALFDKPAFKNIVVNELILDKNGIKMSKSKGNVIDPFDIMEKYGADAVRWYLFVNNPPWKATLFNEEDMAKTILSDFFRSLTNIYAFFALYANIDGFNGTEKEIPVSQRPEIDRWILSRVNSLLGEYKKYMDDYELTKAHRSIQNFVINELSNWYIRRNRRRFWKGDNDSDKIAAYQTLRSVLVSTLAMMAPAAPFLSEDLYQRLRREDEPESIHLMDLPQPDSSMIDTELEAQMSAAQTIVFLVRSLREKSKIRVRQPLQRILVPVMNVAERRNIQHFEDIIKEEINVKAIEFVSGETGIVTKKAKPNFKVIGRKFGKNTQTVANAIKEMKDDDIRNLESSSSFILNLNGQEFALSAEDVEVVSEDIEGWLVASDGNITVALDTHIDEGLLTEGIAREFVNRIQNLRKSSGFEVTDRIKIEFNAPQEFTKAIQAMKDYIGNETLAEGIVYKENLEGTQIDIDEQYLTVNISKI
jgi:isoleucyl-tRNA synthetase